MDRPEPLWPTAYHFLPLLQLLELGDVQEESKSESESESGVEPESAEERSAEFAKYSRRIGEAENRQGRW